MTIMVMVMVVPRWSRDNGDHSDDDHGDDDHGDDDHEHEDDIWTLIARADNSCPTQQDLVGSPTKSVLASLIPQIQPNYGVWEL